MSSLGNDMLTALLPAGFVDVCLYAPCLYQQALDALSVLPATRLSHHLGSDMSDTRAKVAFGTNQEL